MPDAATAQKLYDELDYIHAVDAFINGYPGVNQFAIRKGFIDAGINDNDVRRVLGLDECHSPFFSQRTPTPITCGATWI